MKSIIINVFKEISRTYAILLLIGAIMGSTIPAHAGASLCKTRKQNVLIETSNYDSKEIQRNLIKETLKGIPPQQPSPGQIDAMATEILKINGLKNRHDEFAATIVQLLFEGHNNHIKEHNSIIGFLTTRFYPHNQLDKYTQSGQYREAIAALLFGAAISELSPPDPATFSLLRNAARLLEDFGFGHYSRQLRLKFDLPPPIEIPPLPLFNSFQSRSSLLHTRR